MAILAYHLHADKDIPPQADDLRGSSRQRRDSPNPQGVNGSSRAPTNTLLLDAALRKIPSVAEKQPLHRIQ